MLCFYCCSQYIAMKTISKYSSGITEGFDLLRSLSDITEFSFNTVFVMPALVSPLFQMF